MIWLHPAVLFGLAVAVVPILVHLLVHRRTEPLAFPTLRFLRPARLASVRRRVLDDVPLLAVRCAIVAAVVGALAGPLVVTASRRSSWDRRLTRAIVHDEGSPRAGASAGDRPFRSQEFSGSRLGEAVRRAMAWLESAPPSRRELLIESALTIGSITPVDLADLPADIGIRFVRVAALPATRSIALPRLLTADGLLNRDVTLAGPSTVVTRRLNTATPAAGLWPIEMIAPPASRQAVDAAVAAVIALGVPAPATGRRARIVVDAAAARADIGPVRAPGIAEAIAAIARDRDLQMASRRISCGAGDDRFGADPWQPIARSSDGTVLVAGGQQGDRLVVATRAMASDLCMPILVRATANALAPTVDLVREEILPIPEGDLRAWSRPAGPVSSAQTKNVDEDDRRWLWTAALVLLVVETRLRRTRRSDRTEYEAARVA